MITRQQADRRASLVVDHPGGLQDDTWNLEPFSHGWIIRWHRLNPAGSCIVIERDTGMVRYFNGTGPQQVITDYEAVRPQGQPDYRWSTEGPWAQPPRGT